MLPDGSFAIVQDQISRVLAKGNSSPSVTFVDRDMERQRGHEGSPRRAQRGL
jgi:hypothetical protein